MMSRILSCAFLGVEAFPLTVETCVARGLPSFSLVGLPDTTVRESRERVRAAILNSGFEFPSRRITVNLAPADMPKIGSGFDLPMAMGILMASDKSAYSKYIHDENCQIMAAGELSLDGKIRGIKGILPMALEAVQQGIRFLIIPEDNKDQIPKMSGLSVYPAKTLREALKVISKVDGDSVGMKQDVSIWDDSCGKIENCPDYKDIKGLNAALRAMEIAASGSHSVLMIGPPGAGKTMLASRFPGILSPLKRDESIEVTRIHSIAGCLDYKDGIIRQPPVRMPHHTATVAAMIGGGRPPKPGEITLAHKGVLFLDELPQFKRSVLDALREPVVEKKVYLSRQGISVTMPSDFQLLAAMNPCYCGNFGSSIRACICGEKRALKYLFNCISGPLADRFDMQIFVDIEGEALTDIKRHKGKNTAEMAGNVRIAQKFREKRVQATQDDEDEFIKYMDSEAVKALRTISGSCMFSMRGILAIKNLGRTIADMEKSYKIRKKHIMEAASYRNLDILLYQNKTSV